LAEGCARSNEWQRSERETSQPGNHLEAGRSIVEITGVTLPTLSVYPPSGKTISAGNTGAAVLVFPGGGYSILAYDLEGTEVCSWLNSIGVTCVLVKYRVPIHGRYPDHLEDFEDAQRAMRMTREHAAEWKIDPHRIGVLGFSAGGHLAVVLSIHAAQQTYKPFDAADALDARPDFALVIYPGYLVPEPGLDHLSPGVQPDASTPPTFLVQAENDFAHEENALLYFQALKQAKVPAELHLYAQGGHGYGLRPTELPITHWPALAETWMHTIGVLGG
jgi:acetyl esterase/lipase